MDVAAVTHPRGLLGLGQALTFGKADSMAGGQERLYVMWGGPLQLSGHLGQGFGSRAISIHAGYLYGEVRHCSVTFLVLALASTG